MLDKVALTVFWSAVLFLAMRVLIGPIHEQPARASSAPTVHTAWPANYPLPDTVTHPAAGWTCWHGSETYAVVPDQGPQVWVECRGPNNELIAGPDAYRIVKRETQRTTEQQPGLEASL